MNIVESKLYSFDEMIPYINTYACNHLKCSEEVKKVLKEFDMGDEKSSLQPLKKLTTKQNVDTNSIKGTKKAHETFFIHPRETRDALFWYFYIMKYGYEKYEFGKHKKDVEYDEKYKTIERIKDVSKQEPYKSMLRKSKLKAATIMNDIASNESMTLSSFIGMCIIHDIPLVLTTSSSYYISYLEDSYEDKDDDDVVEQLSVFVVDILGTLRIQDEEEMKYKQPKSRMYYEKQSLSKIQENHILGKNVYKPLNSITNYKVNELEEMADILDIEIKPKMKKKEIFHEIEKQIIR